MSLLMHRQQKENAYAREEVLDECFADLLKGLVFDDQVIDWIVEDFASEPRRREAF